MIEGIEVLSVETPFALPVWIMILMLLFGAFGFHQGVTMFLDGQRNKDSAFLFFAGFLWIILACILPNRAGDVRPIYKVRIEDETQAVRLMEDYEIVSKVGNIYTLKLPKEERK